MSAAPADLFLSELASGFASEDLTATFPLVDLTSPGMPLPGVSFLAAADHIKPVGSEPPRFTSSSKQSALVKSTPALNYLYRRALYDSDMQLGVKLGESVVPAQLVTGHLIGFSNDNCEGGPVPSDVFVLSSMPGNEETNEHRNMVGSFAFTLQQALDDAEMPLDAVDRWYITNVVKWKNLNPVKDGLSPVWAKDCAILLEQELRLVAPRFILCLGSEAAKAVLGKDVTVKSANGRIFEKEIRKPDGSVSHVAKCVVVPHPSAVRRSPELYSEFSNRVAAFCDVVLGRQRNIVDSIPRQYYYIYDERFLASVVQRIKRLGTPLLSVDLEWHGDYESQSGAFVRTVQFSTKIGEAYVVVLRYAGGHDAFKPGIPAAMKHLSELLAADPSIGYFPRLGGHYLRADLPWICEHIQPKAPLSYEAASRPEDMRTSGGWALELAYHACFETGPFGLDELCLSLRSDIPRYWDELTAWLKDHRSSSKSGFGFVPDWILLEYAAWDVDAPLRCLEELYKEGGYLDKDRFGKSSWEGYHTSHGASLVALEMEATGIRVDVDRLETLTAAFVTCFDRRLAEFRRTINWPTFSLKPDHLVALMFGDRYVLDVKTFRPKQVSPPGAMCLGLEPLKTTGKRKKEWSKVVAQGQESKHRPTADRETLGIYAHTEPIVRDLRNLQFLAQTLKSVLRPPMTLQNELRYVGAGVDAGDQDEADPDDTFSYYASGLPSFIRRDGRVHTHIKMTMETGRSSSSRPPLQNVSKRREADYKKILGPDYLYPLRTLFVASPGYLLVEFDIKQAEIAALAWQSGDPTMIDDVRRGLLPEDHPDFFDMHSNTAVRCFNLACAPTKTGMESIEAGHLRVAAKAVNFGVPYDRSAPAIQFQCREEGADVTVEDCEAMISYYATRYPIAWSYLLACADASQSPGTLCTAYGRHRRFFPSNDSSVVSEQQRQARNFPIQGSVADFIWKALLALRLYRNQHPWLDFRILLQIHDAILCEVRRDCVAQFVNVAIPNCIEQGTPFIPRRLDNTPISNAKYFFGVDCEVSDHWGEKFKSDKLAELGIVLG